METYILSIDDANEPSEAMKQLGKTLTYWEQIIMKRHN
jgi:hypothetical protein